MKNYKALKSASKVSLSKTNDDLYYITKKNYNVNTGVEEKVPLLPFLRSK